MKKQPQVVNDNITAPPADKAQVRVINASPDAGEIDVVQKQENKELFSGVNFKSGASYMNVDPMQTTSNSVPRTTKFTCGMIFGDR
jgi:uncharacterized protein DUF4397